MKSRYRLFRRNTGIFFCEDRHTGKQESLRTRDQTEAERLVHAKNEAEHSPMINRQIALAYLSAADPAIATRTWGYALEELIKTKRDENARRWSIFAKDKALKPLLELPMIQTLPDHFLRTLNAGTVSTNVYLRRLHNFALDLNWIPKPVIPKRQWPKVKYGEKRAISAEEHARIVEREKNLERRSFYELCWELGGSQGDIACLNAEDINWSEGVLAYARKKTQQPALVRIDARLEELLRALPAQGPLFPYLRSVRPADRATEFKQRCEGLGITGVTLHSYRYAWAERARQCGYPERFAQEALGHGSKAVHRAYAKAARVVIPSMAEWAQNHGKNNVLPVDFKRSDTGSRATALDEIPRAPAGAVTIP